MSNDNTSIEKEFDDKQQVNIILTNMQSNQRRRTPKTLTCNAIHITGTASSC